EGFQKENALTRQEALKAMTIWAAYGAFEENDKGSLEAGKFADFVVLDKDIMTVPEAELFGVKVLYTYIGGVLVYSGK
ncbi:MAG: amidohydrolase family protein, partial [Chitinophagales bacterium]